MSGYGFKVVDERNYYIIAFSAINDTNYFGIRYFKGDEQYTPSFAEAKKYASISSAIAGYEESVKNFSKWSEQNVTIVDAKILHVVMRPHIACTYDTSGRPTSEFNNIYKESCSGK